MVRRNHPVRTCIGCRRRTAAVDLLRIVAGETGPDGTRILPDPGRRLAGRGAHVCPSPGCLAAAIRRRAIGRALRVSGGTDTTRLDAWLDKHRGPVPGQRKHRNG